MNARFIRWIVMALAVISLLTAPYIGARYDSLKVMTIMILTAIVVLFVLILEYVARGYFARRESFKLHTELRATKHLVEQPVQSSKRRWIIIGLWIIATAGAFIAPALLVNNTTTTVALWMLISAGLIVVGLFVEFRIRAFRKNRAHEKLMKEERKKAQENGGGGNAPTMTLDEAVNTWRIFDHHGQAVHHHSKRHR